MSETQERMARLEIEPGLWLVEEGKVHLADLFAAIPQARVVRVEDVNAVRHISPQTDDSMTGCIAGWVSDEA
jgi:hypothetical protein